MALKTGVPVIPCGITGAFEAYPRGAVFPRPSPVKVSIGKPVAAGRHIDPGDEKTAATLDMIMAAIDDEMGR
jgi:1-acyl-sn-glycerol-3-phosphate acyltransferase